MTVGAAAGWNNLAQGNFAPEVFSKDVLKFFRKDAVAMDITNTDYFGEISAFGDTVNIVKEPTITVADYTRGLNLEVQDLVDDGDTLTVDQAKYFAFAVDDIESKVSHVNWETLATSAASYAIKDSFDAAIFTYMLTNVLAANKIGGDGATASTSMSQITNGVDLGYASGEVSPLTVMARASRLLDDSNVPSDGRWWAAKPEFWEVMSDENSKLLDVNWSHDTDSKLRNGLVTKGEIRGFRCYKSNNLPTPTSATGVAEFGHQSAVATASQIAKTEVMRHPNTFADVVRGLHIYGRKALRTAALGRAYYVID